MAAAVGPLPHRPPPACGVRQWEAGPWPAAPDLQPAAEFPDATGGGSYPQAVRREARGGAAGHSDAWLAAACGLSPFARESPSARASYAARGAGHGNGRRRRQRRRPSTAAIPFGTAGHAALETIESRRPMLKSCYHPASGQSRFKLTGTGTHEPEPGALRRRRAPAPHHRDHHDGIRRRHSAATVTITR